MQGHRTVLDEKTWKLGARCDSELDPKPKHTSPLLLWKDIGGITGGIRLRAVDENCINMNLLTLMPG